MAVFKLKHVERFVDRHGLTRWYYRKGKGKRLALVGSPGSDAFHSSYIAVAQVYEVKAESDDGTFNALARGYYGSTEFLQHKLSTQTVTRDILARFLSEHGHRIVKQMSRSNLDRIIAERIATPAAANNLLKKIRVLIRYGIRNSMLTVDPTLAFKKLKEGEYWTWTEAEIEQFEKHWPLGTRERAAFDLHLYTGQRRSDVHKMEWADIIDGAIRVAQYKGDEAVKLLIPLHSELAKSLAAWGPQERFAKLRQNQFVIICKHNGHPYTVESFGNLMADAIEAAGLPARCVPHGLRKAASRRLAEAGCSSHQIMAITGHRTLKEVERYTRAVSQEGLARSAVASLGKFEKA